MNRHEVREALRTAQVPDGLYRIEGIHEPFPPPTDYHFLRHRDGTWESGFYERGHHDVTARFTDEAAACAHLLREVLRGR
ncbi:hypothetical protein ACFP1Z_09795 [Streptomyces gamaensis]|uniref:Uncharacterized protein n=1 Tax=Streptomyces gamaensis TaxID=1763542 RepID=A0ABW0YYF1_9ACTN